MVFLLLFVEWFGGIGVLVGAGWEVVHVALVGEGDVGKAPCPPRRRGSAERLRLGPRGPPSAAGGCEH